MSQIARNIKLIRKVSKLSQTAFGEAVGLTKDKVYTYENEVTEPDDFVIARIAKYASLTTKDVKDRGLKEDEIKIQAQKESSDEPELWQELKESQKARIKLLEEKVQSETRLIQVEQTLKIVVEILNGLKIQEQPHKPSSAEAIGEIEIHDENKNGSSGRGAASKSGKS